ncbi:helix-turn-helix transcriptional regulator [Lachnospiraceae bacterium 50-23]
MNNTFGKILRAQVENAGIKESELANALGYDPTYISKWMKGSKLPSARNVERIIGQIADFLSEGSAGDTARERLRVYAELKSAYDCAGGSKVFESHQNGQMSFLNSHKELMQLTQEACFQAFNLCEGRISVMATFDLFQLYGKGFRRLMEELHDMGANRVELKLALAPEALTENYYFYTTMILNIIGRLDFVEMSIVCQRPEQPRILVINQLFCLQVLWLLDGDIAAAFSMQEGVIKKFTDICGQIMDSSEKLLDSADPESLKRTNVQLDSYSDRRQWLFFNESPAMLFPADIMEMFIENADNAGYARYLEKLKNVFEKRTCQSRIDLVIYSSMLNKYLTDGMVSVGNCFQQLSQEQVYSHLRYLSEVMRSNPRFKLYVIRDTIVLSEELREAPSIFLDTYSVNIENSKNRANANYHISTYPGMRDVFQRFFEDLLAQSYCLELTAEDLLRYL